MTNFSNYLYLLSCKFIALGKNNASQWSTALEFDFEFERRVSSSEVLTEVVRETWPEQISLITFVSTDLQL